MNIRDIWYHQDLERVFELANEFRKESGLDYEYSEDSKYGFVERITNLRELGMGGILAAYEDGDINPIGALAYVIVNDILDGSLMASELFWYVRADKRKGRCGIKLLDKFEEICQEREVKKITMVHLNHMNADSLSKLYERRGYKPIETHYLKELWQPQQQQ